MLKKKEKGQVGYFRYRKIQTGIAMSVGYLLVLLLFFTGIFIYADRKNLFTAGAILACLPTAKMTVQFLMYPKKGQATEEKYNELTAVAGNMTLISDIYITPEKKAIEIPYAAFFKGQIVLYCNDKRLDNAFHCKFIKNFLKNEKLASEVTFYTDLEKFKKRIQNMAVNEPTEYTEEEAANLEAIIHNFKILSI